MKNILVLYYTQTGQIQRALKATLKNMELDPEVNIRYELIQPKHPFPYPWTYMQFFDTFPETVKSIPCEIQPLTIDPNKKFDLIIIAYQPWFLSVCRPIDSFLQTPEAATLLNNQSVVTILSCRNMWLNGQEKMKHHLKKLGPN
ncbi:MAG: hypothetical protein IPP71_18530 [Bacteroidetes bacterium]|nr:hypothetical protein [Bacteroidota bacterium]